LAANGAVGEVVRVYKGSHLSEEDEWRREYGSLEVGLSSQWVSNEIPAKGDQKNNRVVVQQWRER